MKNIFQNIYIIGAVQGLLLLLLLISKLKHKLANKVLAVLLVAISTDLILAYININKSGTINLLEHARSDMFIYLYAPLVAYYSLVQTGTINCFKRRYMVCLIPSAIIFVLLGLTYCVFGTSIELWNNRNLFILITWYLIHIVSLLYLFICTLYGIYVTCKFYKTHKTKSYQLWLLIILIGVLSFCIVSFMNCFTHSYNMEEGIFQRLKVLIVTVFIVILEYYAFEKPVVFKEVKTNNLAINKEDITIIPENDEQEEYHKYEKNRFNETDEKETLNSLLCYLEETQAYLDPELDLKSLSESVDISPHRISMLINIYLKQNFYTFINNYRIEEVKKRLAYNHREMSILTIALECGFNSKSTFNSVFKRYVGLTPSEYMRLNCQENSN